MGAILHVNVFYTDLKVFLKKASDTKTPVFGTLLEGKSVYNHTPGKKGIILLGNESAGISEELIPFISEKIMIPKYNGAKYGIDSLNVGMAASVILSEFVRKTKPQNID
jgi:TrmH family RNA methyltransferase